MNCEPNDLAVIVRDTYNHGFDVIGLIVQVDTAMVTQLYARAAWDLKAPIKCRTKGYVLLGMYDADLQPIRGLRAGAPSASNIMKTDEALA